MKNILKVFLKASLFFVCLFWMQCKTGPEVSICKVKICRYSNVPKRQKSSKKLPINGIISYASLGSIGSNQIKSNQMYASLGSIGSVVVNCKPVNENWTETYEICKKQKKHMIYKENKTENLGQLVVLFIHPVIFLEMYTVLTKRGCLDLFENHNIQPI